MFSTDMAEKSHAHEIREDWKPPFLSNDEFTQLMLEVGSFCDRSGIMTGNVRYINIIPH